MCDDNFIGVVLVNGAIQDISGIPDGVAVHVYDYDCGLGSEEHFVEVWENAPKRDTKEN
jgi:hypothetical protein